MDEKNYPQVHLEEHKYKIRIIQMSTFINTELDLDSKPDSEPDAELMVKLKSDSANDSE